MLTHQGLTVPIQPTKTGGLSVSGGQTNDGGIILAAIKGGGNNNPFQQNIDHTEDYLYEVDDEAAKAMVVAHLKVVFAIFESQHRFRLIPESIQLERKGAGERAAVSFEYEDIESGENVSFESIV